jgi:hypothetical protein
MSGRIATLAALALLAPDQASSVDAQSANYRLVGSAPASTSSITTSPTYSLYVVGGSGEAVGISASANVSVVTGGTSNALPTDRVFGDGFD